MSATDKEAAARKKGEAKQRLAEAKEKREKSRDAADREFWLAVKAEIDAGNLRQTDAVDATGYGREYIRKSLKELTDSTD
ncbi:hypothetical protein ABT095_33660 [Kitasatospora sp. NPDC002227]|uniref:hypothetical protein n=1 Tax=Kitasatospora sp. NPDC002227 TaxID=3154773 RepID=UPI003321B07C